ncbi:hypothetical protein Q763_16370 [Flavobacterium beibuense F44-8]|uniref:Uncharacterized protein n=1 Tax=Flavobacterium beibuense F44-8 TaxID=1406840 RepID=A0A0A2LI40_9FLAO|nr:hypothetical protein [Flavobacterium beibuense]KGO78858.1 hypothetical protein Q763_16370 [Flavobacterium beibuense F44-8]
MKNRTNLKSAMLITAVFLISVISCQKDDTITQEEKSFSMKAETISLMSEEETSYAVDLYHNQMAKVSRKEPINFDNRDLAEVRDYTGKIHYTYKVTTNEDNERTFHNVVITNWDGYFKTILVKYEMTDEYYQKFTETGDFTTFTGTITASLLTADGGYPCGEMPSLGIPTTGGNGPGGGGGGGDYGDGEPWNPNGNGNPHNQTLVDYMYLSISIRSISSGSGSGSKWRYGHRTPRDFTVSGVSEALNIEPIDETRNPCGDGGEYGVLVPLDFSKIIVDNITEDSNLDPCISSVISDLKNLTEKNMAEVIRKLDAFPSPYTTNIKNGTLPDNAAGSPARTIRTPGNPEYNYTIIIDPEYTPNTNKLGYATIILHEMIHAYLLTLIDDGPEGSGSENFPDLFEKLVEKQFGPNPQNFHHQIMAEKYVDALARALQEFQTGNPVPDNTSPSQNYTDLAWGGLKDAPIYQTTSSLTNEDRERINKRYASEIMNITIGTTVPLGDTCE